MPIEVENVEAFLLNLRTRMPFKYGIAAMTALPHVFLRATCRIDGQRQTGLAADHLPPKWFTKNPNTRFEEDLPDLLAVIRSAGQLAQTQSTAVTVFDLWRRLYAAQAAWARDKAYPPLLWAFGVSLVERAMIDAYCRATETPFAAAVRRNSLGIRLGDIHPDLVGFSPANFLPGQPRASLIARHTVGLGDPLTETDIPAAERLDDGLPQSLAACIAAYGLTHFKLKLWGDVERDIDRLRHIAAVIEASSGGNYAFTLDGNENYKALEPFKTLWQRLITTPALAGFMEHLLFVEQPLHRDVALSEATQAALLAWPARPPIIIDESDGTLDSLPTALQGGYSGTSHKNCKGVFKGIANACLIEHQRRRDPAGTYVMSCEDLSNIGPVALLQDATVTAVLGIEHTERNGHHYFAGLSMFPRDWQQAILSRHSDLYHPHPAGFPTLNIHQGRIAIQSLLEASFGLAVGLDPAIFTPLEDWQIDSLSPGEDP